MKMEKIIEFVVKYVALVLALLINAWFFELIWNLNMPGLFNFKELTFGNAVGILVLCGSITNYATTGIKVSK